jgi:hypothetical protein
VNLLIAAKPGKREMLTMIVSLCESRETCRAGGKLDG